MGILGYRVTERRRILGELGAGRLQGLGSVGVCLERGRASD